MRPTRTGDYVRDFLEEVLRTGSMLMELLDEVIESLPTTPIRASPSSTWCSRC